MCRLYGFRSTAPRKIECELIRSQNSFIVQSQHDEDGHMNAHGWGLAAYVDGRPYIRKQPKPAYESEDFRWAAAEIFSKNVLAHVRRATVSPMTIENTHPFRHNDWTFVHNGEIVAFEEVRGYLLEGMTTTLRASLEGETDSEHIFRYFLSRIEREPEKSIKEVVLDSIRTILNWVDREQPGTDVSLNILMTDGIETVGSRLNRKLWYVERGEVHSCEVCGGLLHVDEHPGQNYRAVVIASERLTKNENWTEIPDRSVFHLNSNLDFSVVSLGN